MSEVYANILETLTSGLYNDVKYAIREYLQNSYDAIVQAKMDNLPMPEGPYCVNVEITKNNDTITISDNGVGMDRGLLEEYTSIGGGTKTSPEYAGHKGIGKLSGLRFFRDFKVITKVFGSTVGYEMHLKCGEMMRELITEKEKMKRTPYKEFIAKYYTISPVEGQEKERHYTQIQLIGVTNEFKDQVTEERIGDFIKQNCPVPFFRDRFKYADKITNWLGKDSSFIDTFINEKVIYQFYDDNFGLRSPQIIDLRFDDEVHAKVWFSWIDNTSEIIDNDDIRGIRFRCKGLCVGDDNLFANNCMPRGRSLLASWFTGEVIVLDENIIPSAARDKFYEGEHIKKFFTELKNTVGKELNIVAETRSAIISAERDHNSITKIKAEGKPVSSNHLRKINEDIKELERHKVKDKYSFDFGIIEKLKKILLDEENEGTGGDGSPGKKESEITGKNPQEILDRLLELKEQEVNAFSGRVKAKKQKQIEQVREQVAEYFASPNKQTSNIDFEMLLAAFIKFLINNHYPFDEKELRSFLADELSGKRQIRQD